MQRPHCTVFSNLLDFANAIKSRQPGFAEGMTATKFPTMGVSLNYFPVSVAVGSPTRSTRNIFRTHPSSLLSGRGGGVVLWYE
jgi:hypothetical protein